MIPLDHDSIFIVGAYAGVVVGVLGLILFALFDARHVKARLAALEAQGIRRRSERPSSRQSAPVPSTDAPAESS